MRSTPATLARAVTATAVATAVATMLTALGSGPVSASPAREVAASRTSESGGARWLVRYAPGTDMAAAARALRSDGATVAHTVTRAVDLAVVSATAAEIAVIAELPRVLTVEPDAALYTSGTQVDPTWGLDRIDQRPLLPFSRTFTTPEPVAPVNAYVVDTGVRATHIELVGRVAAGRSVVPDGRGTEDCNGHGTHVAGTVAGSTFGVAKTATVVPVRVLDCIGDGLVSGLIVGLDWVVGHHQAGVPAVMNLSLGSDARDDLDAAVQAAVSDGITVVTAAGNATADACLDSPARLPSALTVAATNVADEQATFSNRGPCVDLYAPGVDITSAWWTSNTMLNTISGTSMAAPHVAGTAAVLLSRQPALSPAQVAQRLLADATTGVVVGALAGAPNRLLFLDQYEVPPPPPPPTAAAPPPVAPAVARATVPARATSVSAAPRVRSARVRWVPAADGGSPVVDQKVRVYREGERVRTVTVRADATKTRVTRLRAGVAYRFSVVRRNAVGSSAESEKSRSVRPRR